MLAKRTKNQISDSIQSPIEQPVSTQTGNTSAIQSVNNTSSVSVNDSIASDSIYATNDTITIDTTHVYSEFDGLPRMEGTKRVQHSTDSWVFVVLFIGFMIFASVRLIFNKYLNHLLQALFNFTTTTRMYRERVYKIMHASFRLDLLFILMFSLSLFLINDYFNIVSLSSSSFVSYLVIILFVTLYMLSRHSLYRLLGFIFNHQNDVKEYLFDNSIVLRNASMALLPLNTILSFVNLDPRQALLIYSVSIIFIPTIIIVRGFIVMLKKHISFFYLILYLCTLEILPLLLICKIIENYGNG